MITLRDLQAHELHRLGEIDRSEHVTLSYRVEDGVLVSKAVAWDVPRWSDERVEGYVCEFVARLERGGICAAAEDTAEGGRLAGMAILAAGPVETLPSLLPLLFFHVSRPYRRRGVASRLLERVEHEARGLGVAGVYISATPTGSAVGFYLNHGATLLATPDPALQAAEPDDIHMGLTFR